MAIVMAMDRTSFLILLCEIIFVATIIEVRDQIQKLLRQYHHIKIQIGAAENPEEVKLKTDEANKLSLRLNKLRLILTNLETQQRQAIVQNNKATATVKEENNSTVVTKQSNGDHPQPATETKKKPAKLRSTEEVAKLFEERINHIELSQHKTREKLKVFSKVKDELTRLKEEAEKHAVSVTKESYLSNDKLQQEVVRLTEQLQWRDTQYETLKQDSEGFRYQATKETDSLKEQLAVVLEKQKQLEKERNRLFQSRGGDGFAKGLWLGLGISLVTIIIVVSLALFSDRVVCQFNRNQVTTVAPDGQ